MNKFFGAMAAVGLLLAGANESQAVKFRFESEPSDAAVQVIGPADALERIKVASGVTPVELDLPRSSTPYIVSFNKAGFEKVTENVSTKQNPRLLKETLIPLVVERQIPIKSSPTGASVTVNGTGGSLAPYTQSFRFERDSHTQPWKKFSVHFHYDGYQDEDVPVDLDPLQSPNATVEVALARIAEERTFDLKVIDDKGNPVPHATIYLDLVGAERSDDNHVRSGKTDENGVGHLTAPFSRKDKNSPWKEFNLVATVKDEFEPNSQKVSYTTDAQHEFRLQPVTEVAVKHYRPGLRPNSVVPVVEVDTSESIGLLSDTDLNTPATEVRLVTNYNRRQTSLQTVNSFAVMPDGKSVIFAVTSVNPAPLNPAQPYVSVLYWKDVQSKASGVTVLAKDKRYLDCFPSVSEPDKNAKGDIMTDGDTLVVFQSTRGAVDTWNLSAMYFKGQKPSGGYQQLTREDIFDFGPSIGAQQQPIFFSAVEKTPGAPVRIASIRIGSTGVTNYSEEGENLHYSPSGTIDSKSAILYLTRKDPQTGKSQIYSLEVDGQVSSTVITDEQFAKANCSWPTLSPNGDMLLFVSDIAVDEKGRHNNNIFLWDLHKSTAVQLTDNGSDDTMPQWSPTEHGVIYFLSNRRGIYNVWRMAFQLAQ